MLCMLSTPSKNCCRITAVFLLGLELEGRLDELTLVVFLVILFELSRVCSVKQ